MNKMILKRVTVGFRCPMNWAEMEGNEEERFCNKCEKSVTDLSQMSREEAEDFVLRQGPLGKACVRLLRDEDGNLVTKGCGSAAVVSQKITNKVAVGAAAVGSLAVAACSSTKETPYSEASLPERQLSEAHVPLMGIICVSPEQE